MHRRIRKIEKKQKKEQGLKKEAKKSRIKIRREQHSLKGYNLVLDIKEIGRKQFNVEYNLYDGEKKIAHLLLKREGSMVFVFDVFVDEKYRRKGIATELIKHVIERCKKRKIPFIVGVADSKEIKSLLAKLGFKSMVKDSEFYFMRVWF